MDHEPVLISTIAIGLTAAFIGGLVARRLGLPAIVGYILAGRGDRAVHAGPRRRPGDRDRARRARRHPADVRRRDPLLDPRPAGRPLDRHPRGASSRRSSASLLGCGSGQALGWGVGGGLVLGLAVSVASTVVLLRALDGPQRAGHAAGPDRGRLADRRGPVDRRRARAAARPSRRCSAGPCAAGAARRRPARRARPRRRQGGDLRDPHDRGRRAAGARGSCWSSRARARASCSPWPCSPSRSASRIVSSSVFGVSFALGAFLAGAVVGESDMSHQAAADALPLRDAFAVLFFVSVGMLLDPTYPARQPAADPRGAVPHRGRQGRHGVRHRRRRRLPAPGRA